MIFISRVSDLGLDLMHCGHGLSLEKKFGLGLVLGLTLASLGLVPTAKLASLTSLAILMQRKETLYMYRLI